MLRAATLEDIPGILVLGRQMHAESWYGYLPFDEEKVAALMGNLIAHEFGFAQVIEQDGEIVGGLAGMIGEFWFCHERIASDFALFVTPGRRGSIGAVRLVKEFIEWAKANKAEVSLAVSTGVRIQETGELYQALGLTHVGGVYKQKVA